jgi:hypothetical protein
VRLGREVHDDVGRSTSGAATARRRRPLDEAVARMSSTLCEVLEPAGVGQLVERRDLPVGMRRERVADEVRADETGAAGDETLPSFTSDADLGIVAQHEPVRGRLHRQAVDADVASDQAVVDAVARSVIDAAFEHDAVLDLGVADLALGRST